ncbi:MAG: glycosyltransferase family 4 protein [Acidimicrobiia bacterium]
MTGRRVVMGLLFFPRGGSAFVARYLSPALTRAGWSVSLAAGSLGVPGEETHAATFFAGLDVHGLDFTAARDAFAAGGDAIAASPPMHPSYEDRAGVPDVVFASIPPELADHLAGAWLAPLRAAGAAAAAVFHLHHLTPQLDAVQQEWPHVPLVVHLHGTELKMIEAIEARAALAAMLGETLATMGSSASAPVDATEGLNAGQIEMLRTTRWPSWRHGEFWAAHLRQQARLADHVITVSPLNRTSAISALSLDPQRVTAIPNGVDLEHFRPRPGARELRRATFRRVLVDDPHGWTEFGPPGTLRYSDADLDRLLGPDNDAAVLLYVGRFLGFKRVPSLIRAFARARSRFTRPASLVVWGGHPGEWEGEHPVTVAAEVGSEDIYFTGWRGHGDLAEGLAACDALIVPSVDDPYPQVPLEAMASGLPVVASRSGGLLSMVNLDPDRPTGWFVPPDDLDALAETLAAVVDDPTDRSTRGVNALAYARAELSWDRLVPQFESVYDQAIRHRRAATDRGDRTI